MAKGGTLFLDEIGTMPIDIQSMLLRVLQENTYTPIGSDRERMADVRIVAATNEALRQLEEDSAKSMEALTGGLNLGGGFPF